MRLKSEIFRQYDIRGIENKDLTAESVAILGKGIGTYFRRNNCLEVALGQDCRLSSPKFAEALSYGLRSTGCNVVDIGIVPTPLLYFTIYQKNVDSGVMITGSHNPPEYNGFKMMMGKETLYGDSIQDIFHIIDKNELLQDKPGTYSTLSIVPEYHDYVTNNIKLKRPLKIVIDAGNGTGGAVAVPIFKQLGCDVFELYCEMDGNFPNHHPDPTIPEALSELIQTVLKTNADLGIAYDGDADRIGVIDDKGSIIWGDKLMILLARDILPKYPGAPVISEVKASQLLYSEIERLGGRPIMWKTGHSLIKKKIREEGAVLAGEMSGHIFFNDRFFGFDDAVYSSARVAEIVANSDKSLHALLADLPELYNTPEIRVKSTDEEKFKLVEKVKEELAKKYPIIDIDGVRANFPHGWALVRASNTQGVLVLRFEADTQEHLNAIQKEVEDLIEKVKK